MFNDRLIAKLDQWFGKCECEGSEPGSEASNKDYTFHDLRIGNLGFGLKPAEKMSKKVQKKDFVKTTHKVGKAKTKLNETRADSVSSKRVIMPAQNIESTGDIVGEALISLRHYNEKKRLDAIYSLIRNGHRNIPTSYLGDVILGVGFCLCDDDALVRSKCGSFLLQVINTTDRTQLSPFVPKIAIQIRAGLGNVSASVRSDSISFLHRLILSDPIFSEDGAKELIVTLSGLDGTFITVSDGKKSSARGILWDSIELLLTHLLGLKSAVRSGSTFAADWTISTILSRVFSAQDKVGPSLQKLLLTFDRLGEDERASRIRTLSEKLGFAINSVAAVTEKQTISAKKKQAPSSVFSRYSALLASNDDSHSD